MLFLTVGHLVAQEERSTAQFWMDELLYGIKLDGQGPTIQSRNMYHLSLAMYEAWAFYHPEFEQLFLGKRKGDFECEFDKDFKLPSDNLDSLCNLAIHYAAFRTILYRFDRYGSKTRGMIDHLNDEIDTIGLSLSNRSLDYSTGSPECLGNYIAAKIEEYALQDGAKEENNYEAFVYEPRNPPLYPNHFGNLKTIDPNIWQPISIRDYLNQKGEDPKLPDWYHLLTSSPDEFMTPEWGWVQPFALENPVMKKRNSIDWPIYEDPGPPPYLNFMEDSLLSEEYKKGFLINILWSQHMDPSDSIIWDISPTGIENFDELPTELPDYWSFYNDDGGTSLRGEGVNPSTGQSYKPNLVLRGDYCRVIAEYWVDGIYTYSPPGHWMKIMQEISNRSDFERKWMGKGEVLGQLEWDIKSYLLLSGALVDAGIASWSTKGFYDYIRPISAIRLMAEYGQCSDKSLVNYDVRGLPLIPGVIEMVKEDDPLAGNNDTNVGLLKLKNWRGPEYITNQNTDMAGVGWILAGNWWPYQRYSFITPPFAGYISGHSTFSSCGAQVLTSLTGSPYFPDGLYELEFKKNEFLEFEEGPSRNITLQWATYFDAAHETCLSRIWGGIHPPADDIPGRHVGIKVAQKAIEKVNKIWHDKN